jgi:hypothetical protein
MTWKKLMHVFFDTEFTQIANPLTGQTAKLISVSCVSEDGREFYAELTDTYQQSDCSDFVLANVLPLLDGGECRMMEVQLAVRLSAWVDEIGEAEVVLHSDCPMIDFPFIADIFNRYECWPKNLRKTSGTIHFNLQQHQNRYKDGLATFWKEHEAQRHHALTDARSMRFAWLQVRVDNDPIS